MHYYRNDFEKVPLVFFSRGESINSSLNSHGPINWTTLRNIFFRVAKIATAFKNNHFQRWLEITTTSKNEGYF
jgi:hypothetical protein